MPWIGKSTAAAMLAAAALAASAAPFTPQMAALQSAIVARAADLADDVDPEAPARRAACGRALVVLSKASTTVGRDLAFAAKVARLLERSFEPADPILAATTTALDGLETEVQDARSVLVLEISLLSGARRTAAERGLSAADGLLLLAEFDATRAGRAKLLGRALRKVLATRRALRGAGVPGVQGPRNPSFEDQDPFAVFPEPGGVVLRNASNSFVGYVDQWFTPGGAGARTGIGASHGVAKASVGASFVNGVAFVQGSLVQDDVNLSRSRRLRFEWELSGTIGDPCATTGAYGYARLEIRFSTPTGASVVLWRHDQAADPANGRFLVGVTSEVVELPYLPQPGTLEFHCGVTADPCPPPPPPPPGGGPTEAASNWAYVMYVDNLRVE